MAYPSDTNGYRRAESVRKESGERCAAERHKNGEGTDPRDLEVGELWEVLEFVVGLEGAEGVEEADGAEDGEGAGDED